jgi:hypothetical protein
MEKGFGAGADIYKYARGDHNRKAMVSDLFTLVGMATSLPIAPLAKPVNYISDIKEGKAKPTGPIDFTRGFITGQPGKN